MLKLILGSALALSVIFGGITFYAKTRVEHRLSGEKLRAEMLLSEKLNLTKSANKYKADIALLQTNAAELSELIAEAKQKIAEKTSEINRLKSEQTSGKELKQKNADLEKLQQQLNAEIESLNKYLALAKEENSKLNEQVLAFAEQNDELASDLLLFKALISENYRTEALRGKNDKLTINSKKANKLTVSLDLPATAENNIHFKVINPQGVEISSKTSFTAVVRVTDDAEGLLVSANSNEIGEPGTKKVELEYKPRHKLNKGIYSFNIYNGDRFIGSTQLRLK